MAEPSVAHQPGLKNRRPDADALAMHRIVYSSVAVRPLSADELDELLEQSQVKNRVLNVTGLLLHYQAGPLHEECFIQALEGDRDILEELYETITEDPRHHRLRLLSSEPAGHRIFAQWAMAARRMTPAQLRTAAPDDDGPVSVADLLLDPAAAEALLSLYARSPGQPGVPAAP